MIPPIYPNSLFAFSPSNSFTDIMSEVSVEKLEKAVSIAANLVDVLGYDYWPVFERLDSELSERQSRFKRLRKFSKLRESDQSSFD